MNVIDSFKASLSLVKSTVENLDLKNKITDFLSYISKNIMGLFNSNVEYRHPVVERAICNSSFLDVKYSIYEALPESILNVFNKKDTNTVMENVLYEHSDNNKVEENDYEEISFNSSNTVEENIYSTIDDYLLDDNEPLYDEIGNYDAQIKEKEEPIYATINKESKKRLLIK